MDQVSRCPKLIEGSHCTDTLTQIPATPIPRREGPGPADEHRATGPVSAGVDDADVVLEANGPSEAIAHLARR